MQAEPRIRDVVMPKGGPDKYLEGKYNSQEIWCLIFVVISKE